jgi:branched-subunit amino acid transport protein
MNNLFSFMFYFNEQSIIQTLNINIVLQPHRLVTNLYLLSTLQRYVLQLMEFNILWTTCLGNTRKNMIETCLLKQKLFLGTYET